MLEIFGYDYSSSTHTLQDSKDEFLEPDFKVMMDENSFHDPEPKLGNDLLSCIEESLSHSTQANNYFPGMIAAFSSQPDMNEEELVQNDTLSVCSLVPNGGPFPAFQ